MLANFANNRETKKGSQSTSSRWGKTLTLTLIFTRSYIPQVGPKEFWKFVRRTVFEGGGKVVPGFHNPKNLSTAKIQ
jgi:hypothetical protein